MNRGKEPLASLCERRFVLDAIKENKVSPYCTGFTLLHARLTLGVRQWIEFRLSLVISAAGRSRGVRLPLPSYLSQCPTARQRGGDAGKDQVRTRAKLAKGTDLNYVLSVRAYFILFYCVGSYTSVQLTFHTVLIMSAIAYDCVAGCWPMCHVRSSGHDPRGRQKESSSST